MKIIAANWKMYKTTQEVESYLKSWSHFETASPQQVTSVFFVPNWCWSTMQSNSPLLNNSQWGAQNIYPQNEGAFTGENSPHVLKQMGASWTLVGHSERRTLINESNSFLGQKIKSAQGNQLNPLLCVGESLPERELGQLQAKLTEQLSTGLSLADKSLPVYIAYEPIWAIGTGKVAGPQDILEAHSLIHAYLKNDMLFKGPIYVLYGGSVKPENAKEILSIKGVDGLLVGGASLAPDSFYKICQAAI